MANKKNGRDHLMAELILMGGEIMSRQDAVQLLQCENVDRQAIDWAVFSVPALRQDELRQWARHGLLLELRCRLLVINEEWTA